MHDLQVQLPTFPLLPLLSVDGIKRFLELVRIHGFYSLGHGDNGDACAELSAHGCRNAR